MSLAAEHLEKTNTPVVYSSGENGTQISLINPREKNPFTQPGLADNPVGGFLVHTDAQGKTQLLLIGKHGVQNHKSNNKLVPVIGMPRDFGVEAPKLIHPAQQTFMDGAQYHVGNTCLVDLPKDAAERDLMFSDLVAAEYVGKTFAEATLAAMELSKNKDIGENARQIEMERIISLVKKSALGAELS